MQIVRIDSPICDLDGLVQMEFTRTTVVVQTISNIGILLYFDERNTCTDGMDSTRRYVEEIAFLDRMPHEQIFNRAVYCGSYQCFSVNWDLEAGRELRLRFRINDKPALVLAAPAAAILFSHGPSLIIRRVDLNRQLLVCENIFDKKRLQMCRGVKPDLADPLIAKIPILGW